jgi:hypothetical protein
VKKAKKVRPALWTWHPALSVFYVILMAKAGFALDKKGL